MGDDKTEGRIGEALWALRTARAGLKDAENNKKKAEKLWEDAVALVGSARDRVRKAQSALDAAIDADIDAQT